MSSLGPSSPHPRTSALGRALELTESTPPPPQLLNTTVPLSEGHFNPMLGNAEPLPSGSKMGVETLVTCDLLQGSLDGEFSSLSDSCDSDLLASEGGTEDSCTYEYCAQLPGTSAKHYVGRFEDPEDQRSLVEPEPSRVHSSSSAFESYNRFAPLAVPPTQQRPMHLGPVLAVLQPTVLTTIDEHTPESCWSSLCCKRKRTRHATPRRTQTVYDFSEINAELDALEKDNRRSMVASKLRKKERLHTQGGLFDGCKKTMKTAKVLNENVDFVVDVSKRIDRARDFLKYDGTPKQNLLENAMSRLEDLTAFVVGLRTTTSWQNCLSLVHLYVRSFFPQSIVLKMMKWIVEALKIDAKVLETQTGLEFDVSQVGQSIDSVKKILTEWRSFRNSDLARNLANVIDMLVTVGFIGVDDPKKMKNPFRSGEFEKFSVRVWDIQAEAIDFTTMVFETIIFFLERGYAAFVHKDPTLLLYSDSETQAMDIEFSLLTSALPLLECGRLDELAERMNANPIPNAIPIVDSADFDNRVDKMVSKLSYLLKFEKHPVARNMLSSKLTTMTKLRTSLIMQQRKSPIRDKPFCVEIYGGSSVAKTTLCNIFARVLLHANGFACTKDHIVTCNDLDKYQSEYTSSKTAVILDDYANTRADFYDVAPTKKIIDFCNNVNLAALNAEVEKKGNVMIRPKMVLLTTNVKGLLAEHFSNEPVSIQRRFEVIITAKLKPDFVDPATGGPLKEKMARVAIPDAWDLLLETVHIVRDRHDRAELRSLFHKRKEDGTIEPATVGIFTALEKLKEMSREHFATQKAYVACVENFFEIDFCEHSMPPDSCPHCRQKHADSNLLLPSIVAPLCPHNKAKGNCQTCADTLARLQTSSFLNGLSTHSGTEDERRNALASAFLDEAFDDVSLGCETQTGIPISYDEEAEVSFVEYFSDRRMRILGGAAVLTGVVAAVYLVYRIYKNMQKTIDVQGDVVSQPIRLETDVANPWKQVKPVQLPTSLASKTTTVDDLVKLISRKIGFALIRHHSVDKELPREVCNIMPMCGDRWLLPSHMLHHVDKEYEIEVRTGSSQVLGKTFKQCVGSREIEFIPGTDYAIVRLANGGDNYDLTKFLALGKIDLGWTRSKLYAKTVLRHSDGEIENETIHLHSRSVVEALSPTTGKSFEYDAYCYQYPKPTFRGQCMMALISDSASPALLGFHLAGRTNETFGAAGVLLKSEFDKANMLLSDRVPIVCHSSGTFRTKIYDIDFKPSSIIDPKHATAWLTTDEETGTHPALEVFGSHPQGTVRFKSHVCKSPISDAVEDILALKRIHGPPNGGKSWVHWQRDLDLISKPRGLFRPKILQQAADDFWSKIDTFLNEHPDQLDLVHPYDLDTILAGVDGITSVDGVDLKTSMGWPLNKAKSNFIVPSERSVSNVTRPLDIDPTILAEAERVEAILLTGERCYAIHRATKKDEAVKFTKDKIRIFAGAQYALIHVTRKYYLPIIRLIQTNWINMECAVGINAHGKQWSELAERLLTHGRDRLIAGDFKSYDKVISPTLMTEAFGILIKIAKKAGYNADQLRVMAGIATEICYPTYEWDGVFLQAFGSNPSGHPLTVIVNNLANSLYMRYAYYAMHEGEEVPPFHTRVELICYGDDNAQNVSPLETKYNFRTVQRELAKVQVPYTPADKGTTCPEFIPIEEVSFLKRGFVYREDLQMWVAPLEEASISKSLHNYLKQKGSPTTPLQISAQVISGALREYFRFPREVFERRRKQLYEVAETTGALAYINSFPTYDEFRDELLGNSSIAYPLFPTDLECA